MKFWNGAICRKQWKYINAKRTDWDVFEISSSVVDSRCALKLPEKAIDECVGEEEDLPSDIITFCSFFFRVVSV